MMNEIVNYSENRLEKDGLISGLAAGTSFWFWFALWLWSAEPRGGAQQVKAPLVLRDEPQPGRVRGCFPCSLPVFLLLCWETEALPLGSGVRGLLTLPPTPVSLHFWTSQEIKSLLENKKKKANNIRNSSGILKMKFLTHGWTSNYIWKM